jgi:hypothetical protein
MLLPDDIADELADKIASLMHNWSPCDNSSDYICEFCSRRANGNHGSIDHADDCSGKKYYAALTGR